MSKNPTVVTLIDDLFFRSKVEATAKGLRIGVLTLTGHETDFAMLHDRTCTVLLDLHHRRIDPIDWVRRFSKTKEDKEVLVIGFYSHVRTDLKRLAAEAGCHLVIPKSVFSAQLPKLIEVYTKARLPGAKTGPGTVG